jgi:hypothetical protein
MENQSVIKRNLEAIEKALNSVTGEVTLDNFYVVTVYKDYVNLQGNYTAKVVAAMRQLVSFSTDDSGFVIGGYFVTIPALTEEGEETRIKVNVTLT